MSNIEYKSYQIKQFDEYKGEIIGYGVTYGNVDRVNDVIVKNALNESIEDFNSGVAIKFLFEHEDVLELNSNIESIQDDSKGSLIKAKVSEEAKAKFPKQFKRMVEAFKNGKASLSIGYAILDAYILNDGNKVYLYQDGVKLNTKLPNQVRYLEKIKAIEFSFTTSPANMEAKIIDMKNINIPKYPIELTSKWDSTLANQRWREYSNSMEEPSEMYKKAFLYYNQEEANNFGSYHLQVVDIIDGEPMINEKGVIAVYQAMQGARGGLKIVPSSEMPRLIAVIKDLYEKINNVRVRENIDVLPEPDFKMYEIEVKISNIGTRAYAEKFCRQHKSDFPKMSESQLKALVEKCMQVGINQYKKGLEKKLDIVSNSLEEKNIGSPLLETRKSSDTVAGVPTVDFNEVYTFLKKQ